MLSDKLPEFENTQNLFVHERHENHEKTIPLFKWTEICVRIGLLPLSCLSCISRTGFPLDSSLCSPSLPGRPGTSLSSMAMHPL